MRTVCDSGEQAAYMVGGVAHCALDCSLTIQQCVLHRPTMWENGSQGNSRAHSAHKGAKVTVQTTRASNYLQPGKL